MAAATTRANLFHRALRLALCYLLALHAFAASISTIVATGDGGGSGLGFAICHNSDGDTPSPASDKRSSVPCVLCAVAASAVALPDVIPVSPQRTAVAGPVRPLEALVLAGSTPARAGMARAPPHFA